ncbi:MAG: hypothetical protein JW846_11020 [Dehalococcoidia bacterium]|nr:hypothetical protein [Dehalococcoidia bacterium]
MALLQPCRMAVYGRDRTFNNELLLTLHELEFRLAPKIRVKGDEQHTAGLLGICLDNMSKVEPVEVMEAEYPTYAKPRVGLGYFSPPISWYVIQLAHDFIGRYRTDPGLRHRLGLANSKDEIEQ